MCGKCTDLFSNIWDGKDHCWYNWNHISAAWGLLGGRSLEAFTCTICFTNTMTSILLNEGLHGEVAFQRLFLDLWVTLAQLLLVVYKAIFKLVHLIVR